MNRLSMLTTLILVLSGCGASHHEPSVDATETAQPETVAEPTAEFPGNALAQELIPRGKQVEADLLTGGQPSSGQLDLIAAAGYKTVVNMRSPDERGQLAEADYRERGFSYRSIPISGADDVNELNARAFSELLADDSLRPLVVHCGSGNRIGALFALEAFYVQGLTAEEALEVGQQRGLTQLEGVVRERLGLEPKETPAAADP